MNHENKLTEKSGNEEPPQPTPPSETGAATPRTDAVFREHSGEICIDMVTRLGEHASDLEREGIAKDVEIAELRRGPSLAERCYYAEKPDDELFQKVNSILGCNYRNCTKPDFKWAAFGTWTDPYDSSVEVVMNPEQPRMTREQADQILAFGFRQVYESWGEENGLSWSTKDVSRTYSKTCSDDQRKEFMLRRTRDTLTARVSELEGALRECFGLSDKFHGDTCTPVECKCWIGRVQSALERKEP